MKFITCILIFLYHTKLWIIQSTKTAAPQLHYEEIQFNQTLIQRWIPFYDDAVTPHTIGLNMTSSSASCDRETKGFTEQEIEKCQTTKGWICPVSLCGSVLSRKQTLKSHLHTVHNVSAGNPTRKYKEYEFDSTVSIPRSTLYRKRLLDDNGSDTDGIHQSSHEQNNVCHAPEPVESEKDINWEVSYEMENCDVTQYSQTDENGEEIMESVVHHQGEADMDLCDFHEDDDENDGDDDDNNEDDGGDEDSDGDGGNRENEYSRNCDEDTSPPLYIYPPSNQVQNSNISYRQHILSLCAFSLKHNLSGIAFKDLTKLIQIHMPDNSICETDVNYIKKMCANMDSEITVHEYCLKCSMLFTQDPDVTQCTTPGCNGQKKKDHTNLDRKNIFISTDLRSQIKSIMERDDNFKKVTAIKSHNPNHLGDINGGLLYKEMKQPGGFLWPANNNNITLTCFTDGVPLFKSSKVSLWPLYLVINELPPAERFLRKNMMVWGIWQGNDKLRMNTFLYPFVQDLQKLHSEGFTFNDGPQKKSGKALLVIATMDLMARAPVLNMMHHNGECGCIYCETPGITVPSGKGHARSYPYLIDTFQPRTDASVEMNSRLAVERNKVSVGIKGPSVLHAIPRFSLTNGTAIDYMHGALLGIVKKLMELWFHGKSYQMTYFIGHEITDIDCMLKKIKPPYVLKRLPRRIENNYQHWKASEMRSWLLYYSLPCISESSLPEVYIHHYACLVEAIYLLLGEDISESDLQRAERLLNSFYEHFAELYMDSAVGLNVHNLYHLVQCVRYWGPLWVYSCFGFESFNKDVLEVVHGTGNVAMQILWCLKAQKELALKTKTLPDGKIKDFFKDMLKGGSRRLPKGIHAQHCRVVQPMGGTFRFNDAVASNLKELFEDDSISEKHFFKSDKIVYGQIIIYSKNCTRVKKRNSYTIEIAQQHLDGSDIMQVDYFLMKKDTKQVVAVCTLLRMVRPVVRGRAPHCQIVEKQREDAVVLVSMHTIKDIVVFIDGQNNGRKYISRIPNFVERD